MSFLDNLENNLKNLENREERDPASFQKREQERARAAAVAPWLAELRASPYTQQLLDLAARKGFERRTKLRIAWIGDVLRLELAANRLELRPQPEGIVAVFQEDGTETRSRPLDLSENPELLLTEWLG